MEELTLTVMEATVFGVEAVERFMRQKKAERTSGFRSDAGEQPDIARAKDDTAEVPEPTSPSSLS